MNQEWGCLISGSRESKAPKMPLLHSGSALWGRPGDYHTVCKVQGNPQSLWSLTGCVSDHAADRTFTLGHVIVHSEIHRTHISQPSLPGLPHCSSWVIWNPVSAVCAFWHGPGGWGGGYVSSFTSGVTCSTAYADSELGGHISRWGESKDSLKTL